MIKPIAYIYVKHTMEEEKYIEKLVGKRNPFVVPEGYFEQLTDQVMQSLPERRPRAKTIWLRPVFYAAASVCALFVCATVWLSWPDSSQQEQKSVAEAVQTVQQQPDDAFFDEAADYIMLDNQDIYACLSDY